MRRSAARIPSPILILALLAAACGGGASGPDEGTSPPELTAEAAEAIVRDAFPAAEVTVQEVVPEGERARVAAEFMGSDVTFVLELAEEEWSLAAVEQGGVSLSPARLREVAATVATMREVSNALERYREANGELPQLDDQVGLQELVPEFYPQEGELSDVWGQPFHYRVQGREYTLVSIGPDGEVGTPDDLVIIDARLVPPRE